MPRLIPRPLVAGYLIFDVLSCKEDYVTSQDTTQKIAEYINEHHPKKKMLYDLGSSWGSFALAISSQCPQLRVVAVDNSLLRVLISQCRALFTNTAITCMRGDIFKTDIASAELVYIYLPRVLLPDLAAKLEKELCSGAAVTTSRVCFPHWEPHETLRKNPANKNEEDIFIYQFPFQRKDPKC